MTVLPIALTWGTLLQSLLKAASPPIEIDTPVDKPPSWTLQLRLGPAYATGDS